ncbi:MAG: histidine kinase [Vicinamibacterales bacterium]
MNDLLNALGLATGLALYAMLLAMVGRDRTRAGRVDAVPLATGILGLVWNLCSLSAYVLPRIGADSAARVLSVSGPIALGFLPAVVVHSVVRGPRGTRWPHANVLLLAVAYLASVAAALIQVATLVSGQPVPSVVGLRLLTWTFLVLAVPLVAVTSRQPGGRRALWIVALAAFAVSALHLSQFHESGTTWPMELLGHHASIPLAVAILYQDYPFALADLFLKRALLLIGLVSTALAGLTLGGMSTNGSAPQLALLAGGWVATALVYPWARHGINWFVDTIVLARPDYRSLEGSVLQQLQLDETTDAVLDRMQQHVRQALGAAHATWRAESETTLHAGRAIVDTLDGPSVNVIVPTSEAPGFVLECRFLSGGRRVLSGDVAFLSSVAIGAARRIDAIRLTQERYERVAREQEVAALASQAELRALRAQLNPHFLFNALTTIGYLIQSAPPRALDTLMRLTALLRGVLRSEGDLTTLGRELDLIEAYLDIERARYEHRLRVRIDVPEDLRVLAVPPLILQPLVENAVKHGIAPLREGGEIIVTATQSDHPTPQLVIRVTDTGPGLAEDQLPHRRQAGVGLNNVERRLQAQYGRGASLTVTSRPAHGTTVEITIPTSAVVAPLATVAL